MRKLGATPAINSSHQLQHLNLGQKIEEECKSDTRALNTDGISGPTLRRCGHALTEDANTKASRRTQIW